MAGLAQTLNIARPDDVYAQLVDLHDGLSAQESAVVSAKLILLLANHIGDAAVLAEAMALARKRCVGA